MSRHTSSVRRTVLTVAVWLLAWVRTHIAQSETSIRQALRSCKNRAWQLWRPASPAPQPVAWRDGSVAARFRASGPGRRSRLRLGVSPRHAALSLALMVAVLVQPLIMIGQIFVGPQVPSASAHNLNTTMVYTSLDPASQALLDSRVNNVGTPLLQVGDQIGLIIKIVAGPGTTTGVGGYVDFYVPNGVQVTDAAYVIPDGTGNYPKAPMKGQSLIAIGDGPIGAKAQPALAGLTLGPNINGVSALAVENGTNLANGTIAGVYGDTGIFYSTSPETAYGTYSGGALTNNSGDTIGAATSLGTLLNKWDAEQEAAYGIKGSTNPAYPSTPIIDNVDGRGNAPWGLANMVAGPQSGYQWEFDKDYWDANPSDPNRMKNSIKVGPWQRIKYPGSNVSKDQPGLRSTTLGLAGVDASTLGVALSPANPLPATVSQSDTGSPKTIRWSIGQLTLNRPEYVWVQFKVNNTSSILDQTGCPIFHTDTMGGDAGGDQGGKDHIWRYYDPTDFVWNGCLAASKAANVPVVKVGDTFQYPIKVYNLSQTKTLTNVVIQDTLPSGLTFISAVPSQNSGPNPLVWNVGTLKPGQKFETAVTVKVTGTGPYQDTLTITSNELPPQTDKDITPSGSIPYLILEKTASPTSISPGGTVTWTAIVKNSGSGPSGNPSAITEFLPAGFTYASLVSAIANGANVTAGTTVNSANPSQPVFTIPAGINPGQQLALTFTATASASINPGQYCNQFSILQSGVPLQSGQQGCVTVGGGQIGDTVYRDWNGNGAQDPGDLGFSGVTVSLYAGNCPPSGGPTNTATTDATGNYLFTGLTTPGNYCVVPATPGGQGVPSGYSLTTGNNPLSVSLSLNQQYLTADFGYKPGGTGSIGDTVFDDLNNNGTQDGGEAGIPNVTVDLYADNNANGIIDATDPKIATTTTNGSGVYGFSSLATGLSYLVDVNKTQSALTTYFSPNSFVASTNDPQPVANLSGSYLNADFGFFGQTPGSIGDKVCIDSNGDNLCSAGETGLPGITVNLFRDANGDGVPQGIELVTATTTDGSGLYSFPGLGPGTYIVTVSSSDPNAPAGYVPGLVQQNVTLTVGQNVTTADFPYTQLLSKTASPASTTQNSNITFTLKPNYTGGELLSNLTIMDPIPAGTTYVNNSATAGGTEAAYSSSAAVGGNDGQTTVGATVSPITAAVGGTLNVTVNLANLTGQPTVSNAAPTLTVSGGSATCTGPSPASATIAANANQNFAFVCTPTTVGDFTFTADATGTVSGSPYDFPAAISNSALVTPTGGSNIVTWSLGSNTAGVPGISTSSGTLPGLYAFQGNNKNPFWRYDISPNTWTAKANALANVKQGGALTYDGSTYIYGFQGNGKNVFWRYSVAGNTWAARANAPANVSDGGALVYLAPYVYALQGGGKNVFWRYDPTANSWTTRAPLKVGNTNYNVSKGGALTTDGTYIYALQGGGKKIFLRYDPTANTWSRLADTPANVNAGGALVRLGNFIYAFQGDSQVFWRYDIVANTWTTRATLPVKENYGGALTTDGTYIYALAGNNTTGFYRYDPTANTWVARAVTPAQVNQGGALVFVNGAGTLDTSNAITAVPTLITQGDTVNVVMTLRTGVNTVTNVTPSSLTINRTNVTGGTCTGPTPSSQPSIPPNTPLTFTWSCSGFTIGTTPGSLTFAASASGTGGSFASATSNSIITVPTLSFQAQVGNPTTVSTVQNAAIIMDDSGAIPASPSNTTRTPITGTSNPSGSIGDTVCVDSNSNGLCDVGEPGVPGVTVYLKNQTGTTTLATTTTDVNGNYIFPNLAAGTYTITYDQTTLPAGDIPSTPVSLQRTLVAAQQVTDADFGVQPPGTYDIGDTVWLDSNNDGAQQPGELGLPNIGVNLYRDINGNGSLDAGDVLLQTTTTDANGLYDFTGLPNGKYIVQVDTTSTVTAPNGSTPTLASAMTATTGTLNPRAVTVNNANILNADFGYNWSGQIGDTVYYDDDGSQTQNGEPGVAGVVVDLYLDSNGNSILDPEPLAVITATDANGNYLFSNLPGNYIVEAESQTVPNRSNPATAR
ncbi:MAG: SdrD B-like domain-containing protein [Anaerolineae bacterium]